MSSFLDRVESSLASSDNNEVDQSNRIKSNLRNGILSLSEEFLKNARDGVIKVEDTKDLKDIATVYQLLSDGSDANNNTPDINARVVNFYSSQTANGDVEHDGKPSNASIVKGIEEMDSDELSKFMAERDKDLDKSNEEEWEA